MLKFACILVLVVYGQGCSNVSFRQPCTSPKNQPSAIRSIVSR